jgi:hypothetical protein
VLEELERTAMPGEREGKLVVLPGEDALPPDGRGLDEAQRFDGNRGGGRDGGQAQTISWSRMALIFPGWPTGAP